MPRGDEGGCLTAADRKKICWSKFTMGLCQSTEDKQLSQKSKAIDREMMQGHIAQQKVVKLLLLGAGECGKSTVLKQMRILHDHGFSPEEAVQQKSVVYNNTVQAMAMILRAMNSLKITFENPAREKLLLVGNYSAPLNMLLDYKCWRA
ncbi:g-protein alpha subunit [Teladorsagia circumcincta]|uniref:G-protein alpha subunit n=1 Tax=Teladorsagia circumcincta TaxID=45464 RepID=A0A2G9UQ67_TELCI|nr:g-protein alpha subunit [Teladorsagia circumcincta]